MFDFQVASAVRPKLEQNVRDSSIETLLSNVPLDKRRPTLLHSVSITAAANVDDEIHLQKYRSDTDSKGGGGMFELTTPSMLRSKSTIETSKDLKNRIKISTPKRLKHLNEEAYGKRYNMHFTKTIKSSERAKFMSSLLAFL